VDLPVALRLAGPGDEPLLRQVFAGTRRAEVEALGAGPAADAFLATQYELQLRGVRASSPDVEVLVIELDGRPVGRVLLGRGPNELDLDLADIAVLEADRRRGIGEATMRLLAAIADAEHRRVRLHVRRDSPAIRLYERAGFVVAGETDLHLAMERPLS
jgi:ribosomal protein S18 acetylase RimI-like enzyme